MTFNKWKILCLILVITNAISISLLLQTKLDLSESEDWLIQEESGRAHRDADADFLAGKLRVYEIQMRPYPGIGQPIGLPIEFTGRKDGGLEVWTLPRYKHDERGRFRLKLDLKYLNTYNERMKHLHQHYHQTSGQINSTNQ